MGNLPTLRLECDYEAALPADASNVRLLRFADMNQTERIGWHEINIAPAAGVGVFDSTVFGGASLSDELRAYPTDRLTAPLDERAAQFSFTTGQLPANARPLLTRDGRKVEPPARDRLAELIAVRELTVGVALIGVVLWGTISGAMLPFLLRRLGFDPATASAPFVATLVDVTGLIIYFTVASIVLRGTLL